MGEMYGYVRVSSTDQNEDRQLMAMRKCPITEDRIYLDKISGKNFKRPQYRAMLRKLKPGDTLCITSIDRLGRITRKFNSNGELLPRKKRWILWYWTCLCLTPGATKTCSEHSLPIWCYRFCRLSHRTNGKIYENDRQRASRPQKKKESASDGPANHFQRNFIPLFGYGQTDNYPLQRLQNFATWRNLHSDTELS